MGDDQFEKELKELETMLKKVNSIKVIKNIKFLVIDYIEEAKEEKAISN